MYGRLSLFLALVLKVGLSQAQDPTCGDGESVFSVQANTGDSYYVYWRLEDTQNGTDLMGCDKFTTDRDCMAQRLESFTTNVCLATDGCYRLILGDQYWTYPEDAKPYFNATFNGKEVASWTSYRFQAVDFGDACRPACSNDQALFEYFLFRRYNDQNITVHYPDLSWKLKTTTGETLAQGVEASNSSALRYIRECVPRGICLNFTESVPETHLLKVPGKPDRPYEEDQEHRIQLDDVIFADGTYLFGDFRMFEAPVFELATLLGTCTVDEVCDAKTQALLDVELTTPSHGNGSTHQIYWNVNYDNVTMFGEKQPLLAGDEYFSDYISNSSFRMYECVPNDLCFDVYVAPKSTVDASSVRYKCSWNGKVIVDKTMCDGSPDQCAREEALYEFEFGHGCPTELSAGGIAGIVIGVAAFLGIAVVCYKVQHRRKQRTRTAHGIVEPASEEKLPDVEPSKTDRINDDVEGAGENHEEVEL